MRKNRSCSGQISIYLSLCFALILSLFLSVMEAARSTGLRLYMECAMESALNSALADYNRELLENYDVLFVDLSYGRNSPSVDELSGRLSEYFAWNLSPGEEEHLLFISDFYDVNASNVDVTGVRLATDDMGNVFRKQATDYIKQYVGVDQLERARSWITVKEEKQIDGEAFKEEAETAKKEWDSYVAEETWSSDKGVIIPNITSAFDTSLTNFLFLTDLANMSSKSLDETKLLSHRKNVSGDSDLSTSSFSLTDEMFFCEYIMQKFGNYSAPLENSALDYEVEYILWGFRSDMENYKMTCNALFYMRCSANMISICTDSQAMSTINEISDVIAFFVEVIPPQLISLILIVIWAQFEGGADVKSLLNGDKVPLIKQVSDFTFGPGFVENSLEFQKEKGDSQPIDLELSLSYSDYLRILLYGFPPVIKTFRAMDLMESKIRKLTGNEHFRMDAVVDAVEVEFGLETGFGHLYSSKRSYFYFD